MAGLSHSHASLQPHAITPTPLFPPPPCLQLFGTGKLVVTGTKNEDDGLLAARKIAKIVQKLGFPASFSDFKVQNMDFGRRGLRSRRTSKGSITLNGGNFLTCEIFATCSAP